MHHPDPATPVRARNAHHYPDPTPPVPLQIFERYGFKVKDYYSLKRLDPAYRVYFPDEAIDVPGATHMAVLQPLFRSC